MRRRVINALGEIGDERALDTLTQALKDEDAAIRRAAAAAIAEIGGDSHPHPRPHPRPRPNPNPNPRVDIRVNSAAHVRTAVHVHTVVR